MNAGRELRRSQGSEKSLKTEEAVVRRKGEKKDCSVVRCLIVLAAFVDKTAFSPLNYLDTFVKY